ncbi:hypothetical protein LCGC14_2315820 [marine sediment metagenome]|uniref:Imelysin-like domain-containing protein n=1 Tax=marine sediment metagenome TaxID=412755 RepID=A0A0F9FE69_9ZZZZ
MGQLRRGITTLFAALVLAVSLAACSANQLAVSGGALDAMGNTFVTTANLYNKLHDAGKISDSSYRKWASFAKQFKVIYPAAVETWQGLEKNPGDSDEKQKFLEKVLAIKQTLLVFYAFALDNLEVQ